MKKDYKFFLKRITTAFLFSVLPPVLLISAIYWETLVNNFARYFSISYNVTLGIVILIISLCSFFVSFLFPNKKTTKNVICNFLLSICSVSIFIFGAFKAWEISNSFFLLWFFLFPVFMTAGIFFLITSKLYTLQKVDLKSKVFVLCGFLLISAFFWMPHAKGLWEELQFIRVCNSLVGKNLDENDLKNLKGTILIAIHSPEGKVEHEQALITNESLYYFEKYNTHSVTIYQGLGKYSRFGNGWQCELTARNNSLDKWGKITNAKAYFYLD